MSSTFFGLDIALSGLYASNAKLNTTAHNISNAQTKGYTRQTVTTQASKALSTYTKYGMVGTGVDVTGIEQTRNAYYDLKYWKTNTTNGEYETKSYYIKSVENYFNEIKKNGFTTTFDKFFDALSSLSNETSSLEKREQVTQVAQTFADYFNYMNANLNKVQTDLNFEIKNNVDKINSLAEEISNINLKINTLEFGGVVANDLRDQRSLLIDELSNICSISVEEKILNKDDLNAGHTSYVVKIDGQILVDTYNYNKLECVPRDELDNQNDADGLYDVRWTTDSYGGQTFNMYSESLGGVMQGLVQMRDGNNLENLKGHVSVKEGDTKIIMTNTSINDINKLNIPETGYITIGGREYKYTGFTVDISKNADGSSKFMYTFDLEKSVEKTVTSDNASIGTSVDYKGVPYYLSQLNEFLRTFSNEFNSICNDAKDLNGDDGEDFFLAKDKVSGETSQLTEKDAYTSFTSSDSTYYKMTVGNIVVNSNMSANPSKFPAASDVSNGIENNDMIRKMVELKSDNTMFKQGKPAAFLQTLISEIGVDSAAASKFAENQSDILESIEKQRLSESGVDTDEETMDLITFHRMYQLNAKVVSVMNEVLNNLINEMGL